MAALSALFVIIIISLIVVHIGSIAFSMTGLNDELARFQAQSAFTGVGYTTNKAKLIIHDPARRKIISNLILLGYAGRGSAIAALVIIFWDGNGMQVLLKIGIILAGLLIIWIVARLNVVAISLNTITQNALKKWSKLEVKGYVQILEVDQGYSIAELKVSKGKWLCDKKLNALDLNQEGVLVLGINRKNRSYVGAPKEDIKLGDGDVLTCYGKSSVLKELAHKQSGASGDE